MSEQVVRLVMPAKSEYLILARLALAGIASDVPFDDDVLADLKLAVTEACGNAVRHAYGEQAGMVEVRFVIDGDSIAIEVRDEGLPQPELAAPSSTPNDGLPPESGMGLAIIESVVDELEVGDGAAGGTVVRMRKRLGPVDRAPSS